MNTVDEMLASLTDIYWKSTDQFILDSLIPIICSLTELSDKQINDDMTSRTENFTVELNNFDKTIIPTIQKIVCEIKKDSSLASLLESSLRQISEILPLLPI